MCPRCRCTNEPHFRFCTNCGAPSPETIVAAGPSSATIRVTLPQRLQATSGDATRSEQVDHTETGIWFLVIGLLLSWVPLLSPLGLVITVGGGLATFLGFAFLVKGRGPFGPAHGRNVVVAVILFVGGIVVIVVLGSLLVLAAPARIGEGFPSVGFESAIMGFLYGVAVAGMLSSVSVVLAVYALQTPVGRAVLLGAWAAQNVVQLAVVLYLSSALGPALAQTFEGGAFHPGPLDAVFSGAESTARLALVPSLLFAVAYVSAWRRIKRGELPKRTESPGTHEASSA